MCRICFGADVRYAFAAAGLATQSQCAVAAPAPEDAAGLPKRLGMLQTVHHPERVDEIVSLVTDCYAADPACAYIWEDQASKGLDMMTRFRLEAAGEHSLFWLDDKDRVQGPSPALLCQARECAV